MRVPDGQMFRDVFTALDPRGRFRVEEFRRKVTLLARFAEPETQPEDVVREITDTAVPTGPGHLKMLAWHLADHALCRGQDHVESPRELVGRELPAAVVVHADQFSELLRIPPVDEPFAGDRRRHARDAELLQIGEPIGRRLDVDAFERDAP